MRFKQFILNEDIGSDEGSAWFYGSQLLPSDAYDWPIAYPYPAELKFLLTRWEKEKKLGRKFINIDQSKANKQKFTAVYSATMPDTSDQPWKHKPDTRANLEIDRNANLQAHGHRGSAELANILWKRNPQIDRTKELDGLFGKYVVQPHKLPDNFDKPWKHKKE